MTESNDTMILGNYDTTINVIGGLKDCDVIYKAIESHFSKEDSLRDLISVRNEFNLRTEKSRTRIETAIRRTFLSFKNQDHRDLTVTSLSTNGAGTN